MQEAATMIIEMQDASGNSVAKHDELADQLNARASIFNSSRIKSYEDTLHTVQADLKALQSQGGMSAQGHSHGPGNNRRAMEHTAITGLKTQGSDSAAFRM